MIGLYFDGQWFKTRFGNERGNIELDLNLEENHEWTAEATMNPVEEGAPVTDHVIEQSDKLRIKGFISDTPLIVASFPMENRTQPVFDMLRGMIKAREPVTVYTKYRTYPDMFLTAVNLPFAAGLGEAIEFGMDFVHIRKVSTQLVDVPPGISKKNPSKKAQPQKQQGKENGRFSDAQFESQREKKVGFLKSIIGG